MISWLRYGVDSAALWWMLWASGKWTSDILPSMMTLWRHIISCAYFLMQCLVQRTKSLGSLRTISLVFCINGQLRNITNIYLIDCRDIFWNIGKIPGDTKVCSKFQLETGRGDGKYQVHHKSKVITWIHLWQNFKAFYATCNNPPPLSN